MRVLLTGATGFLGAHILRRLLREKVEVAILLRESSNTWRIDPLLGQVKQVKTDFRQLDYGSEVLREFAADTVIHAAWSGVMNRHRNDASQIDDNVGPGVELVRKSIEWGCRNFIGLGSQAEYGPLNRPVNETDLPRPTTLYGASKLAVCTLAEQLCAQAGVRFAWLRVFSTYGPMEDLDWMIPYLVRTLLEKRRPALTAGEQKWDYLFAADAAEAVWAVARKAEARGIFNLGSGRVYTLRNIVETIRNQIDPDLPLGFGEVPYRPDQVMHLEADITRLRETTGWTPATSLESGIGQDIQWHREQLEGRG